ncbi:D-alanyl-D-alanine carboxypeptidase family protein [Lederbergia graminis]|uniref:D-alanyl-D-alanine carboxypeptidase family protein n=1 Tax=Lederbergia graminis TaxID=735518 RepID=A0ABW0LBU8_9BACI
MRGRKNITFMIISTLVLTLLYNLVFAKESSAFNVSASGAVLMEQDSGRILYATNPHEVHRIASITKVMTAILAIESGKMDELVTVSKEAVYTEGSSIYLQVGEKIKLRDLVYGLMLRSGNDAARAIAEHVGGSLEGFVFLMNQKAEEIGMENTVFANPHGLDDHEEHYSTAYDMALLTRYAMNNEEFKKISGTKVYKFKRESGMQQWTNKNRLLKKYKYTTGGKTGFTKRAGRTLITTAEKDGTELIVVTLNDGNDWNDHINMYEHGFSAFPVRKVLEEGPIKVKVDGLKNREIYIEDPIFYPLNDKETDEVNIEYKLLHLNKLNKTSSGKIGVGVLYFQNEEVLQFPVFIRTLDTEDSLPWWQKLFNSLFGKIGAIHD